MYSSFKAQSAVEYLMTYGWMLLAVSIVGGSLYSVSQSQNVQSSSGFTGEDVRVDNFGLTSNNNLNIIIRNSASNSVQINAINISSPNRYTEWTGEKEISMGETSQFALTNVTESDGSTSLDLTINYDNGGLQDIEASGTISGAFELTNGASSINQTGSEAENFQISLNSNNSPVTETENFDVNYTVQNTGDVSGGQEIYLYVNGVQEDSQSVNLSSNESASGNLTWSTEVGDSGSDMPYSVNSSNSSISGLVSVTAAEGPTAQASVNTTTAKVNESLEFDGSSSTEGDSTISSYSWNFSDGSTGTGSSVIHSYDASGNYTAELEVQDQNGLTDMDAVQVEITENTLPEGTISHRFEGRYDSATGIHGTKEITDYSPTGSTMDVSINVQITENFDYAGDEDARHVIGVHLLDESGTVVDEVSDKLYFDNGNGETNSGSASATWSLSEGTDYSWRYFYGIDDTGINEPYGPAPDDVDVVADIDLDASN